MITKDRNFENLLHSMEPYEMMRIKRVRTVEQLVIESTIVPSKRIGALELFVESVGVLVIWLGELWIPSSLDGSNGTEMFLHFS